LPSPDVATVDAAAAAAVAGASVPTTATLSIPQTFFPDAVAGADAEDAAAGATAMAVPPPNLGYCHRCHRHCR
jgi:hypothetical protein